VYISLRWQQAKKTELKMKFKSRKDIFFKLFIIIIISLLLTLTFVEIYFTGLDRPISIFTTILMLSVAGLLLWSFFNTEYELTQTQLRYRSGPIHGEIKIEEIKEIIKGKTLWSGLKLATAKNGLIIKYQKYEEIYISPKTNDSFVTRILELNQNIKITIE
jgi:hypothetical protein